VVRGENVFFLHLPLATKLWIYLHLSSPSLENADLDHWELSLFPRHNFQFNLENIGSLKLLEEEENDQPLS
jgi:hypothetical protein